MDKGYTTMEELAKRLGEDLTQEDKAPIGNIGLRGEDLMVNHLDLIKEPIVPLEYVLHPILTTGGYVLLHAEAGVGKTHFCLNLAYAIAQGGRFLKYAARAPRKVLYVDAELGKNDIRRRMESIQEKQGELVFDNLHYLFFDQFPNGNMPQIDTEAGRRFYTACLVNGNYAGIFLDNLVNLTTADLNKPSEWYAIQQWILQLRKLGIFFFLLHHAGSDVTKQLGTTARITIANTVISLQRPDREIKDKVKVEYQKARDMKNDEAREFIVTNHMDGSFSYQDIETNFEDMVLTYWRRGLKEMAINKALCEDGIKSYPKKVYRAMEKLKQQGKV